MPYIILINFEFQDMEQPFPRRSLKQGWWSMWNCWTRNSAHLEQLHQTIILGKVSIKSLPFIHLYQHYFLGIKNINLLSHQIIITSKSLLFREFLDISTNVNIEN